MNIEYKKIDDSIYNKIVDEYGEWVKEQIHDFHIRNDTFTLAAMDGDIPAGFVCATPRALIYPLKNLKDAYIEDLEVHENYRRQGIGQHLIESCEDWARKSGFRQIRTHSSDNAVEAINMWRKLNYGLCPHDYHEYEPETDEYKNLFSGYWVAKILNPSAY